MTQTPFTQELLYQIYDDNGLVTMDLLREQLPDWADDKIKHRLGTWKTRKNITYTLSNGDITDFEFLKIKEEEEAEITEGRKLKLEEYYVQVVVAREIMAKETASDTNKLKAMQLQQEAMNAIPDRYFKEFNEIYG
ncbi:hypothetical protein [Streptococcus pluranimalium]|uniref:hypothetical protein n=1 Tax=Streptococcus pluranimalium TaxID=82348 RepID=UPI0031386C56